MIALRTGKKVGPVTRGIFRSDKNDHVWLNIMAIPLFQPGETEPFQVYATFEDITQRKQMEEAHTDITQRKRAEQEIKAQQELLEGVMDNVSDVLAIQKPDHSIERYNQTGYDFLGMTPEEVKGKKCYELIERARNNNFFRF